MVEDFSPQSASNQAFQFREMQYLYRSGDLYTIMVLENDFTQFELSASQIGDQVQFLKEGLDGIKGTFWEGRLVGVNLPNTVELKLVQVEQEQISGRIVLMGYLETGAKIELPKMPEPESMIIVDTRFGKFAGIKRRSPHN